MKIERMSPFTGEVRTRELPITEEQMQAWRSGMLIQNAFPQLSASDREFILTGISDDEWDDMFGEEE